MDRYRILESVAAAGVFCTDAAGRELRFANARWRTLTGLRDDQHLSEWMSQVHPEDREGVVTRWLDAVAHGEPFRADYRFLGGERGPRWVRVEALPERDEAGVIIGYVGSALDVTTTHFEESLRDGQNLVLELIVAGAPISDVMTALARAAESQAEGFACTVMLLDDDGAHLRVGAAPSLPLSYTETIEGMPIGPDEGSCGTAAFRRAPVMTSDLATDPRITLTVVGANNLIGAADAAIVLPPDTLHDDPLLLPLADNGGPTWTMALEPASPAIDTGNDVAALATDQRGGGYVRVSGAAADIGAYERQPLPDAIFGNGFEPD